MGERLTTGEVCTRSVTIAFRDTPLLDAARLMRAEHVGCLVVVEDGAAGRRTVVGLLTDRDIVTAGSYKIRFRDLNGVYINEYYDDKPDQDSADPVTVGEDDSLIDLMRAMRAKGVRRIPVVGAQGELIGIATLDDVLAILSEELSLLVAAIEHEGQRERQLRR
ncbi:MAG: CBS domain-containing protein [Pseudomonadota bacterium]|nr:CBS domain-containing protein [Pseudomonadota bacterium]